jgi:ADP-heptose:LPS heptosyltransferase
MAGIIKKYFPHCKVVFLGRNYTKDVIALSEYVDEFINYDDLEKLSNQERIAELKKLRN